MYYVYIMANKINTVVYVGVTSDLLKRVYMHKNKVLSGFSAKYNVDKLVYYEVHATVENAINREKQIKKWKREWKNQLVESCNKEWADLGLKLNWLGVIGFLLCAENDEMGSRNDE